MSVDNPSQHRLGLILCSAARLTCDTGDPLFLERALEKYPDADISSAFRVALTQACDGKGNMGALNVILNRNPGYGLELQYDIGPDDVQTSRRKFLDVDQDESLGATPLILAIAAKNTPLVRFLLDHGSNPTTPDSQGLSPYDNADDLRVKKLLLDAGCKPNGQRLLDTIAHGRFAEARLLFKYGCPISSVPQELRNLFFREFRSFSTYVRRGSLNKLKRVLLERD